MSRNIVSEIKRDYINNLVISGKRTDGRALKETREIKIERGIINTAEGSARVNYGGTDIIAGVKMGVGEPYPDSPDEGVLTTGAELMPIASADFESGPPREHSIELARVVDRGIRESKAIDLKKLCIAPSEKVWILYIDIQILDYKGNMFDAATLSAISALTDTVIPAERFEVGEDRSIEINHFPVACTVSKLGNNLIADPDIDEESISSARLTVTTDENGDIRAMQKGNNGHFTLDELKTAIEMALKVNQDIRGRFTFLNHGK